MNILLLVYAYIALYTWPLAIVGLWFMWGWVKMHERHSDQWEELAVRAVETAKRISEARNSEGEEWKKGE